MKESTMKLLGFNDKWLMLFGIPLGGLVISFMMFYEAVIEDPTQFFLKNFPISIFYTLIYWFVFRFAVLNIRRNFGRLQDTMRRITIEVVVIFISFTLIETILEHTIHPITMKLCGLKDIHAIPKYFGIFLLAFLILAIYEGIYIYQKTVKLQMEKEQLKQEKLISQLHGLKNQVQPHFLFNSLNTLATLIPKDADKGVRFVEKLSQVYRYLLDIHDHKLISLEEEIDYLEAYIHLMKERYPTSLRVEIDIPQKFRTKMVAPLSLQLLVENAIKHNVISKNNPLDIKIDINADGYLRVNNNLQLKQQIINTSKVGLENIKKRYQFLCDKPINILSTTTNFIVSIPLLNLDEVRV